jgi:hypothetical protein
MTFENEFSHCEMLPAARLAKMHFEKSYLVFIVMA